MDIGWLKQREHKRGRDPLGVQTIGIHLYGILMPGITNVTDRLRYYSFYPWVLKTFKTEQIKINFFDFFRRSDFFFGLISNYHHIDKPDWSGHMVGTRVMSKAISELEEKESIKLSKYASEGSEQRYFKNKLGGFGQYYLGPLVKLGILTRGDKFEFKLCDRGNDLADSFYTRNKHDSFIKCIINDKATKDDLNDLKEAFCACSLQKESREHRLLSEYIYEADDLTEEFPTYRRRQTLALLFSLLKQNNIPVSYWELLNSLYYGITKNGKSINISNACLEIARLWNYYIRQEYFSVGLSGIFTSLQHLLDGKYYTSEEVAEFCWNNFIVNYSSKIPDCLANCHKQIKKNPYLKDVITWLRKEYDSSKVWDEKSLSEFQISYLIRGNSYPPDELFLSGLVLILFSIVRTIDSDSKELSTINLNDVFERNPANLVHLNHDYIYKWQDAKLKEIMNRFIVDYVLRRHLEVAISKLYSRGIATFRIVRENERYTHNEMEFDNVERTNPRLSESLQMLTDLGMVKESDKGFFVDKNGPGDSYFKDLLNGR